MVDGLRECDAKGWRQMMQLVDCAETPAQATSLLSYVDAINPGWCHPQLSPKLLYQVCMHIHAFVLN